MVSTGTKFKNKILQFFCNLREKECYSDTLSVSLNKEPKPTGYFSIMIFDGKEVPFERIERTNLNGEGRGENIQMGLT